jgi:formylglycine-generating enzyme required for sulfatase activity
VLVTDTSEGVQWEVDHVLADPTLRAKSLFVASPVRSREEQSEALGGIARALGQSAPLPSDTIALAATDAGGVQALTSPTLSSDAYASALNLRLQQDFGLEVEFKRPRGKVAQVGAGLLATGVVGAGAAAAVMMAVNPQMFAPAEVASREVTEDVLAEPPPPNVPEFDDCNGESWCPRMVQIPAGSFEDNHDGQPNGRVNIGAFAVGRYKISRAQWAAFVAETSRAERLEYNDCSWREPGFPQSDSDPVVCISWNDAHDYVQWLSQRTGHTYRLLTDAEWDYAARAGSEYFETTSYVSSPNDFGLYDLNRDPWEWTQDCLPDRDLGFPADGSAQRDGLGREGLDCGLYMMRGGDTHDYTQGLSLRSGYRRGDSFGPARRNVIGFRVARTE